MKSSQEHDVAHQYLKMMFGETASFRDGQWEAIESAIHNHKVLVVQQTGWGKSLVYFITTKILRSRDRGPTVLISPLLSLVRNQIASASSLGIVAESINSQNVDEWDVVNHKLKEDVCDILLISPEQLANRERLTELLSYMGKGIGLFVVDEAHCISDWGHDFRPDYRRISNLIKALPPNVPVIATTATANQRVVEDIISQLGDITLSRGPLVRESLSLQVIKLRDQAERLAWLAEHVPNMPGVGIIYCLTIADCNKVSKWLNINGIQARAYTGKLEVDERKLLEDQFMNNQLKCVVATIALGMGYDKSDIGFVIHYQRPGNVVSYYQQIGRAGRKLNHAYAILLNGAEDDEIQEYFIDTAFPTQAEMLDVVSLIENSLDGLNQNQLSRSLNMKKTRLEKCLKYLEVENVINKGKGGYYFRTVNPWVPDLARSEQVTKQRYEELEEMRQFVDLHDCSMQFIARKLDDPYAGACGKCSNCMGQKLFPTDVNEPTVKEAIRYLKGEFIEIEKRKQWPAGVMAETTKRIPAEFQIEEGRALCTYGDSGWGKFIHEDKYLSNFFREELVDASVELIKPWLRDQLNQMVVTFIPSQSNPELIRSFANRVAKKLNMECRELIQRKQVTRPQRDLENSSYQCQNAFDGFKVDVDLDGRDILLIDDIVDSRWTLTVCGYMLKDKGAGSIYPFAIASVTGTRGAD